MPDHLLPPQPEKPPGNPWLSWPVVVVALLVVGYFLVLKTMQSQSANLHFIFRQTPTDWEKVRTPAGYPDTLRVSSGGMVWVRTWGQSALSRWNGKTWQYFSNTDFGTKTSYKDNEFALDGEELWETTLDPEKRTLLQVQLEDANMADDMFRTLMGEKVEPRREFIQKHALEVKDSDYHGA